MSFEHGFEIVNILELWKLIYIFCHDVNFYYKWQGTTKAGG